MFDVAVIGGGPAGAAAALRLADAGWRVIAYEREPSPRVRIGESVGPGVRARLEALGLADHWDDPRHRPALERASAWVDESLEFVPAMIQRVRGVGRQLDRDAFDRTLLDRACRQGVVLAPVPVVRVERTNSAWTIITRGAPDRARWLIDASGRGGFARQLGLLHSSPGRDATTDFALIAFVDPRPDALARLDALEAGRAMLIEATPTGWWYSALLADGRLAAAFMTDAEGLAGTRALAWARASTRATHSAARLLAFDQPSRVEVRPTSPRLLLGTVAAHLAIGDASLRGDPLAGQGIEHALDSAAEGVAALLAVEAGDAEAIERRAAGQHRRYHEHLSTRQRLYAAVERFADREYWRARAHAPDA